MIAQKNQALVLAPVSAETGSKKHLLMVFERIRALAASGKTDAEVLKNIEKLARAGASALYTRL